MTIKLILMTATLISGCFNYIAAQRYTTIDNCHSHNDYDRAKPFYDAYNSGFGSIEADIFLLDGELYVAHDANKITKDRTLKALYLDQVVKQMDANKGKGYSDASGFQLLIDLKTNYKETLPALEKLLLSMKPYFDTKANPGAVRVVVSGSMPPPDKFAEYDPIIFFDGRPNVEYTTAQAKRLGMVSTAFSDISSWKGIGSIEPNDIEKIKAYVNKFHDKELKVRFWGCPDTEPTWALFMRLDIDYINTDRPATLAAYIKSLKPSLKTQ